MNCLFISYTSPVSPKFVISTYTFQLTVNVTSTIYSIYLHVYAERQPCILIAVENIGARITQFVFSVMYCSFSSMNSSIL